MAKPYRETVDRLAKELTACQQGRAADKRRLTAKRERAETELRTVTRQQHRERHRYRQLIRALIAERDTYKRKLQDAIALHALTHGPLGSSIRPPYVAGI